MSKIHSSHTIIHEGEIKSGIPYVLAELTKQDVTSIFNNQGCVIEALLPHQNGFILPKSREAYLHHFMQGYKAMGCFIDDKLVGHCLIHTPNSSNAGTGMVDMVDFNQDHQLTAVIKNVCVLPKWRNNTIARRMAQQWHNPLLTSDRKYCLAEVAYGNMQSLASLLAANFSVVSMGIDPDDQTIVFNMLAQRHSLLANIIESEEHLHLSLANDHEKIACALKQGYHGVRCHQTTSGTQLVMVRPKIVG